MKHSLYGGFILSAFPPLKKLRRINNLALLRNKIKCAFALCPSFQQFFYKGVHLPWNGCIPIPPPIFTQVKVSAGSKVYKLKCKYICTPNEAVVIKGEVYYVLYKYIYAYIYGVFFKSSHVELYFRVMLDSQVSQNGHTVHTHVECWALSVQCQAEWTLRGLEEYKAVAECPVREQLPQTLP